LTFFFLDQYQLEAKPPTGLASTIPQVSRFFFQISNHWLDVYANNLLPLVEKKVQSFGCDRSNVIPPLETLPFFLFLLQSTVARWGSVSSNKLVHLIFWVVVSLQSRLLLKKRMQFLSFMIWLLGSVHLRAGCY
jgi:hypothetical protein